MSTCYYYARHEREKEFDDSIRDAVKSANDKALMALYVQNQAILNMLRKMDDKQTALRNIQLNKITKI